MFKRLAAVLHPFSVIASELTIIRELYELELMRLEPPIVRVTEEPTGEDTEVFYGDGRVSKKKSALPNALQRLMEEGEEDESDDPDREYPW
jgi:hypothetical protein